MSDDIFTLHRGELPLLISVPHDGTLIPDAIAPRLIDSARHVPDTDWHIARLYDFARAPRAFELTPPLDKAVLLTVATWRAVF